MVNTTDESKILAMRKKQIKILTTLYIMLPNIREHKRVDKYTSHTIGMNLSAILFIYPDKKDWKQYVVPKFDQLVDICDKYQVQWDIYSFGCLQD